MFRGFASRFFGWVKVYSRENWGAPFVLGFIVLSVVAAVFLAVDSEWLASEVAIYAYFALVVGVVLQLVCFLKQKDRESVAQLGAE